MSAIRVRAHAKINLSLRVLGRRADGYHDLRTVFQALDLHDTLTLARRPGPFVIDCADRRLPLDSTNLVWRAADLLRNHAGETDLRDVSVHIEKRIPMKAGLGGGSADAAAALVGLARLWHLDVSAADLSALGRQIGADVGFFFTGGAALGVGRGDEITPLADLPALGVVLVLPPFDVSTADAYRWWDEGAGSFDSFDSRRLAQDESFDSPESGRLAQAVRAVQVGGLGTDAPPVQTIPGCSWPAPDCDVTNDFEAVVAARHPQLRDIVAALKAAGASAAAMTGSGSAVFGLFEGGGLAARAARALGDAGHAVVATRTIARAEYAAESAPAWL